MQKCEITPSQEKATFGVMSWLTENRNRIMEHISDILQSYILYVRVEAERVFIKSLCYLLNNR